MKSIFLPVLALLLSLTSTTLAQENQKPAQPLGDDSEFRTLHNPVISADGAWMAAEERPDRGDGNVRVWSTERDLTFTIERGQNPRISRDSRWVSALQKPPLEDSRTAKPKNERAGQTLVLLDTQDGSRRTFDFVLSYDMTYASTYLLYLQSPETKADEEGHSIDEATKPAAKERKVGTLHLVHLKGDKVFTIANVAQHATHETSNNIAYVLHDKGTGRDQLRIAGLGTLDTVPGFGVRGMRDGEKIEGLRWARDIRTLAFLDSTETTGKDGKPRVNSALYTWHVTGPSVPGKFTRVDTLSDTLARSTKGRLRFTRDGRRLYFGLGRRPAEKPALYHRRQHRRNHGSPGEDLRRPSRRQGTHRQIALPV